jgi:hypothetical protein
LDNKGDFTNAVTSTTPFRYPIPDANEYINCNSFKLIEIDAQKKGENNIFKELITKINLKIDENNKITEKIKSEYEEQLKNIKQEFENKLLQQQNKYNHYIESIKYIIFLQNENIITSEEVDVHNKIINDAINIVDVKHHENVSTTQNEATHSTNDEKDSIKKNRPKKLSECFKTDTIFHHYKCGINEYAKYISKQDCIYRYSINQDILDYNEIFYTLNNFTTSNYNKKNKKNKTNRTTKNNAYIECNYKDNKTREWISCDNIQTGIILN